MIKERLLLSLVESYGGIEPLVEQLEQLMEAGHEFGWNRYSNDATGRAQEQWDQDELETGIHHSPRPVSPKPQQDKPQQSQPQQSTPSMPAPKLPKAPTAPAPIGASRSASRPATRPVSRSVPKVGLGMKSGGSAKPAIGVGAAKAFKNAPKRISNNIDSSNNQQSMVGADYSASTNPFAQTDTAKANYSQNFKTPTTQRQKTKVKKVYGNMQDYGTPPGGW